MESKESLKIAICDDDEMGMGIIANAIGGFLNQKGIKNEICEFTSAREVLNKIEFQKFHLLMLDIDMPDMDGVELAKVLRKKGNLLDIIFVSGREDRVFDSLKVSPIAFIRKNHLLEDIPDAMEIYLRHRKTTKQTYLVQTHNDLILLNIKDILYFEGSRNYQVIHTKEGECIQIRKPMKEIEEELRGQGFIRIHKGFLLNYEYIKLIKSTEVLLVTGEHLPMSRRKEQEVKGQYLEIMTEHGGVFL